MIIQGARCSSLPLHRVARRPVSAIPPVLAALLMVIAAGCSSTPDAVPASGPLVPPGGYAFWPPLPDEPRVQFLKTYAFSSDVEPPASAFDKIVFGSEREVLPIGKPYGVEMWNGRIYVCDITNPGVVILDLARQHTSIMFTRGAENMAQPTDIAIAPDGFKYVADRRIGRIFVFNQKDEHVSTFGWRGFTPAGVAVRGDELLVPDAESKSILRLSRRDGTRLGSMGGPGGEEGRFIFPLGISADAEGNVYVSDVIRGRVQKFNPQGEFVHAFGQIADAPGSFVRPKHLVVDDEGVIYVVDAAFQNVQLFNDAGEVLMYFGSPGEHPGSMSLPAGIALEKLDPSHPLARYVHPAFDAKHLLIVTNQFGLNKVSVYAMGRLKEGMTAADIESAAVPVETGIAEGVDPELPGELTEVSPEP